MNEVQESAWDSPAIGDVLTKQYSVHLIVLMKTHGSLRYNFIVDQIENISTATVSKRLDGLIEAGLVEPTEYDGHLRVEYSLTDRGQALSAQLESEFIGALEGKHAIRIICGVAEQEPIRYMEFKRGLEITSDSTLSHRLKELCGAGLLDRKCYDDVTYHVEYSLTERGHQLYQVLQDGAEL